MKKLTLVLLMIAGVSITSFAQRNGGERANGKQMDPKEIAAKRTDKMKADLGLDEKQYQELLALNEQQAEQMLVRREQGREEMQAKREEMKESRKAYEASLKSILTPEQFEKHKAAMEAKKTEVKEKRGDRPQGGGEKRKRN